MAMDDMLPVPGYEGKYLITRDGVVYKQERDGSLRPLAQSGVPRRVRLYYNGREARPYTYTILLEAWGDGAILKPEISGGV